MVTTSKSSPIAGAGQAIGSASGGGVIRSGAFGSGTFIDRGTSPNAAIGQIKITKGGGGGSSGGLPSGPVSAPTPESITDQALEVTRASQLALEHQEQAEQAKQQEAARRQAYYQNLVASGRSLYDARAINNLGSDYQQQRQAAMQAIQEGAEPYSPTNQPKNTFVFQDKKGAKVNVTYTPEGLMSTKKGPTLAVTRTVKVYSGKDLAGNVEPITPEVKPKVELPPVYNPLNPLASVEAQVRYDAKVFDKPELAAYVDRTKAFFGELGSSLGRGFYKQGTFLIRELGKPPTTDIGKDFLQSLSDPDVQQAIVASSFLVGGTAPLAVIRAGTELVGAGMAVKQGYETVKNPIYENILGTAIAVPGLIGLRKLGEYKLGKGEFTVAPIEASLLEKANVRARPTARVILQDIKTGKLILTLDKDSGRYGFPGGGIDAGESALAAAQRELREEIGIKNAPLQPLGQELVLGAQFPEASNVFLAKVNFKDIKASDDVVNALLFNPSRIQYEPGTQARLFEQRLGLSPTKKLQSGAAFLIDKYINEADVTFKFPALVYGKAKNVEAFFKGDEQVFLERVKKPSLKSPRSLLDYARGRKPGQFKKFQTKRITLKSGERIKTTPAILGETSQYNVRQTAQFVGAEDLPVFHGTSRPATLEPTELAKDIKEESDLLSKQGFKVLSPEQYEAQFGKAPQGEGGLYVTQPFYKGGPGYLGINYLGLKKARPTIKFSLGRVPDRTLYALNEPGPKVFAKTEEPNVLTYSRRGKSGSESEFNIRGDTVIQAKNPLIVPKGGDFQFKIYGRKVSYVPAEIKQALVESEVPLSPRKKTSKIPEISRSESEASLSEIYYNPLESISGLRARSRSTSPRLSKSSPVSRSRSVSNSFTPSISKSISTSNKPSTSFSISEVSPSFSEGQSLVRSAREGASFSYNYTGGNGMLTYSKKDNEERKKRARALQKAYNLLLKRRGKFVTVKTGLTRGRALQLGSEQVQRELSRQFKIVGSGLTSQEDIQFRPSEALFRAYKVRKGKKINLTRDTYIQRTKATLQSREEKQLIKLARKGLPMFA